VTLPEDLADDFFLYTLAGSRLDRIDAIRNARVRDAVLWRYLMRYEGYLHEEHLKKLRDK